MGSDFSYSLAVYFLSLQRGRREWESESVITVLAPLTEGNLLKVDARIIFLAGLLARARGSCFLFSSVGERKIGRGEYLLRRDESEAFCCQDYYCRGWAFVLACELRFPTNLLMKGMWFYRNLRFHCSLKWIIYVSKHDVKIIFDYSIIYILWKIITALRKMFWLNLLET